MKRILILGLCLALILSGCSLSQYEDLMLKKGMATTRLDPEATLRNFNSWALYHPPTEIDWTHTGFFSYTRSDFDTDTREEMLAVLAGHFGLENETK